MKKILLIAVLIVLLVVVSGILTSCNERVRYHDATESSRYFMTLNIGQERG